MCSILISRLYLLLATVLTAMATATYAAGDTTVVDKAASHHARTAAFQPITIEITTHLGDQQTFIDGDIISFFLNLDKDAYIMVVYVNAQGNSYQVIPNKFQSQHHYSAGLFIAIPPADADYRFKVGPPYGEESLWVFASDRPIGIYKGNYLDNGLKQLMASPDELRQSIQQQAIASYGEAHLSITTRAAN